MNTKPGITQPPVATCAGHLNKQNKNINLVIRRLDYHLTQPCPSEEKQTKPQYKSHPIKLTQTTGPTLGGQKPKERIHLEVTLETETSNNKFEEKKRKSEKYCTNEGTN